ncbi:hypothetical protein OK016_07940 [Vibrio chagasii]|nr:hypothetical protein [Vibrio chagasii]
MQVAARAWSALHTLLRELGSKPHLAERSVNCSASDKLSKVKQED